MRPPRWSPSCPSASCRRCSGRWSCCSRSRSVGSRWPRRRRRLRRLVRRRSTARAKRHARRAAHGARHARLQREPGRRRSPRCWRWPRRCSSATPRASRSSCYPIPRGPRSTSRKRRRIHALREKLGDRMRVWYRRRHRQRRPQSRQSARLRDALGRPLRLHGRARRRQHPRARHSRHARARDGGRSESRLAADGAAARGRPHVVRATAAIRRRASTGRSSRAAWRAGRATTATTGATTRSFASARSRRQPACRSLPGKKPFGGAILSHDFVEAALLRRAGWSVRMLPTLGGSWEDSPPSLLDVAARDRRWAQGNIQHLAVIWSQGFTWSNRMHMGIGVMSYLASPLWFALIVVGLGHGRPHRDSAVRVFHRRALAVPALAVVRQRAHDSAVRHRHDDAADAEALGCPACVHRWRAAAHRQSAAGDSRRRRRDDRVGVYTRRS